MENKDHEQIWRQTDRDREAGLHIERYDFHLYDWTHGFEALTD